MARFKAEVLDRAGLGDSAVNLVLSCPDDFVFEPGQTVVLTIDSIQRPYSFASAPRKGSFDLCIRNVEGGALSPKLCSLSKGAKVDALGPLGFFKVKDKDREMVFISTGTGIAPFRSMISSLLESGHKQKLTLLAGFRKDILYHDDWSSIKAKYKNFDFHIICSQPDKGYKGDTGRVQALIEKYIPDSMDADFYLCGVPSMVEDVDALLKQKGFNNIYFEKY